MKLSQWTVVATRMLLIVNSAFWLGFGVLVIAGRHPALPSSPTLRITLAMLAIACSVALFSLTCFVHRSRLAYYALVVLLGTLALLTVLDDFGLADLAYLVLDLAALALLLRDRGLYLPDITDSGDASRG
jgi:hypothetical protein